MKSWFIIIAVFVFCPRYSFSQCRLDIEIEGIKSGKGNIMLQLQDEKENILDQRIVPITGKTCTVSIKDLKPGKYAIRYYHDENLNGKMETNMVGKPLEGYGFSNNAAGVFGPPSFDKCLFELSENKKIILRITY